jgi:hypothetical protein
VLAEGSLILLHSAKGEGGKLVYPFIINGLRKGKLFDGSRRVPRFDSNEPKVL